MMNTEFPLSYMFDILFAILLDTLFFILFALLVTNLAAVLFAITMKMLFLIKGPVML